MSSHRRERLAELLRSFLATELSQLMDPRFQLVTITEIDVAPDLRNARVFWSLFRPNEPEQTVEKTPQLLTKADDEVKEVQSALDGVKGQLKRRIGQELELRFVPDLHFRFDSSAAYGSRIDYLLDRVKGS